jgi:hypothetical protein
MGTCTHLGLALDALLAAQRRLIALLLLFCGKIESLRTAIGAGRWLRIVVHGKLGTARAHARPSDQTAAAAMRHGLLCGMDITRCVV